MPEITVFPGDCTINSDRTGSCAEPGNSRDAGKMDCLIPARSRSNCDTHQMQVKTKASRESRLMLEITGVVTPEFSN